MTQHAMSLPNQAGASFRADLNALVAALVSLSSGATAPSPTFAWMFWEDTSTSPKLLKQRNGANSAWITHGPAEDLGIQTGGQAVALVGGTNNAITLAFTPAATAFWAGPVWWKSGGTANSSTTPTVKRDGLAAKTAVKQGGAALAAGDIPADTWMCSQYDAATDKEMLLNTAPTGAPVAATQAEQEAASSTTAFVTPGRQRYHPSAAKCWGSADFGGGLAASYGISSVTDIGVGQQTYTFSTAFSSAAYGAQVTTEMDPGGSAATSAISYPGASAKNAGSVQVITIAFNTYSVADVSRTSIACFGDN
jgi:hypothetical protein